MHNLEQEKEMSEAYIKRSNGILLESERFEKDGSRIKIGLESEVAIHSDDLLPEDLEKIRDSVIAGLPEIDVELGAAQIELRTPPIDIASVNGLQTLKSIYQKVTQNVIDSAHSKSCNVLRVGANPFLPVKNTPRTSKQKYQLVPDFYNMYRRPDVDTSIGLGQKKIDIGDAAIVSLFQSFQVNIEASSFTDACDKMNRSFFIAPYLLACSGNARFLDLHDTQMNDVRMLSWQKSHDTEMQDIRLLSWEKSFDIRISEELREGRGLRVGLPERYFVSMADYFDRVGRFPFILYNPDAAFDIAIGITWLDTRVKFIKDSCVVELRLLSTQPTLEEEMLLMLWYIGRLFDSQRRREILMPLEYVRQNRLSAMLYGRGPMWFMSDNGILQLLPYKEGIQREIVRACRGLEHLGLGASASKEELLHFVNNSTPSERLADAIYAIGDPSYKSMEIALRKTKMLV